MLPKSILMILFSFAATYAATVRTFDATSGSPTTQGWSPESGLLSSGTVTDLGQTALQLTGNSCCGYWFSNLSSTEWSEAFARGWSLSATVRSSGTAGVGYLVLDVPNGSNFARYDVSFGNDGVNGWAGLSVFGDSANPALKTTFAGNVYHLLDMRYDPLTQTAGLWVDGVQTLSGYTGHSQFREGHGPIFGVTGFTTLGLFQNVQFSINDPAPPTSGVPEPKTVALVGAALLLLGRRDWRLRNWSRGR